MHGILFVCVFALADAGTEPATAYKGEVKKVDADKGTITVSVGGKEKTFTVSPTAKITFKVGVNTIDASKDGLKDAWFVRFTRTSAKGRMPFHAELTTEKKDGKEVVTKAHVFFPTKK
jgi:hypothetical protein